MEKSSSALVEEPEGADLVSKSEFQSTEDTVPKEVKAAGFHAGVDEPWTAKTNALSTISVLISRSKKSTHGFSIYQYKVLIPVGLCAFMTLLVDIATEEGWLGDREGWLLGALILLRSAASVLLPSVLLPSVLLLVLIKTRSFHRLSVQILDTEEKKNNNNSLAEKNGDCPKVLNPTLTALIQAYPQELHIFLLRLKEHRDREKYFGLEKVLAEMEATESTKNDLIQAITSMNEAVVSEHNIVLAQRSSSGQNYTLMTDNPLTAKELTEHEYRQWKNSALPDENGSCNSLRIPLQYQAPHSQHSSSKQRQ